MRALPVPRPPGADRGSSGGRRGAVVARGVLHDPPGGVRARAPLALALIATAGLGGLPIGDLSARAYANVAKTPRSADSPVSRVHSPAGARRAPSNPPLASGTGETGA